MELLNLMVPFLLALSFLFTPSASASDQLNLNKQLQNGDHAEFNQPSLPRKLNPNHGMVKSSAGEEDSTHDKVFRGSKEYEIEENAMINAAEKETRKSKGVKEEEEGGGGGEGEGEYSTMDYVWVKRRRPIHNKQIPSLP